MATKHKCPVPGCAIALTGDNLMCPIHWGIVPQVTKDRIWRLFRDKLKSEQARSNHFQACQQAIRVVALFEKRAAQEQVK